MLQLWFLQVSSFFPYFRHNLHIVPHFLIILYPRFRAGVAEYMKTEWRVVAMFNVVLFVVLVSRFVHENYLLLLIIKQHTFRETWKSR